ncbi:MAG: hypothetical protein E7637_07600 [Ruminococcaceae bacterium]|nr:hypothetical protein [Oscillospiraceae bacterium]
MHNDGNVALREKGLCGIVPCYAHEPLRLNGVRLDEFCIVYPRAARCFEKTIAESLAARIFDLCGDQLQVRSDEEMRGAREILILGKEDEMPVGETEAQLVSSDRGISLCGKTPYVLGLAMHFFLDAVEDAVKAGHGTLTFGGVTAIPARREISLMGYNFYGFHAYQTRMDNICRVICKYLPDVLCIQEPDLAMMALTHANLDGYYQYYNGRPRHGEDEAAVPVDAKGANSVAPILYNATRYRLLSADTKWMSDTPDVPSKFADSVYYRHFSYVELEDLVTDTRFAVVNLHLQRHSAVRQMNVVFEHLNRLFPDVPVFLIGDFNNEADKPVLYQMREIAGFASAHDTAKKIRDGHNRIDWIMYTKDCADAEFYHCCTETYPDPDDKKGYYDGRTPSDHFAFYAEVSVRADVKPCHDWSAASRWEEPAGE